MRTTSISRSSAATVVLCLTAACGRSATRCTKDSRERTAQSAHRVVEASAPLKEPAADPSHADASDATVELAPLASATDYQRLPVDGFRDAIVSIPHGAKQPRPVIVALHGNYDRPEWQCEVWREALNPNAFILCPRGIPRGDAPKREDRWTYGSAKMLESEIAAAMQALVDRYPQYVDRADPILIGFSLGAILATHLVGKETFPFRRLVLIEGGYKSWHPGRAKGLAPTGRVLFACGQGACKAASERAARVMRANGLETRVVLGGKVGHTYDGVVARAVQQHWIWLSAGDIDAGAAVED